MEMGARNQCDATAALISRFHREWGISNARGRAHALLALHRDAFGGGGCLSPPVSALLPDASKLLHLAPGPARTATPAKRPPHINASHTLTSNHNTLP